MKRVLITGGTGSLGHALLPLLLSDPSIERIVVFSRDEQKQWTMRAAVDDARVVYFLGDVRDRDRLAMALRGVDSVIHAAALKIVPKGEWDPSEFVKTNVVGADNLVHAAIYAGVAKVLFVSTDKAVAPINLYGATKLCAEKLFVASNAYRTKTAGAFAVVRYGNVAGSRGSVIQSWRSIASRGDPLPITHPDMTRFWIELPWAAQVVLSALRHMQGGEIFVPKMSSFRLVDLAAAIDPHGLSIETGIRPGEKIHEDMITVHESRNVHEDEHVYVILPPDKIPGCPVSHGFHYASNSAGKYLTVEALRERLEYV